MIIALPTKKTDSNKTENILGLDSNQSSEGGMAAYDGLEEKLADSLADVVGIGKVKVVLTYQNKEEKILPNVQGVLIIAQGGDSPIVVENIKEAVQALFQVEAHKIKVMKMK